MTRIINIIILALLLPIVSTAQNPVWLQDVERTEQNLQIHKQDILDRMANDEYRRQEATKHALRTPYVKP
ncbi:MAG: hypothetical protein IIT32_00340, partial [Bacteroidales bacterium]|nr:hypothetical protein [Bacteroidales bacterium]